MAVDPRLIRCGKAKGGQVVVEDEVRRATKLLETLMHAAGVTRKDLDQQIGAGPGYVSQILTGRMELKFRHVIALLQALEVEPHVFFGTLYPALRLSHSSESEVVRWLQGLVPTLAGSSGAVHTVSPAELEKLIGESVRAALEGRLDRDGDDSPRG